MKKQHIKEIICRAKRGKKKIMEKLNRAAKCFILGPQNLGSGGGPGPRGPPPGSAAAFLHCGELVKNPYQPVFGAHLRHIPKVPYLRILIKEE